MVENLLAVSCCL